MLLLKNADLYAPEHVGKSDVLVGGGKILAVSKGLDFRVEGLEIYDLEGKILAPGLIDQHVHITGGGGEAGYHSRTPEITLSGIIRYGTTTVRGYAGYRWMHEESRKSLLKGQGARIRRHLDLHPHGLLRAA